MPKLKIRSIILSIICLSLVFSAAGCKNSKKEPDTAPPPEIKSPYEDFPTVIIDAGHGGEDGGAVGDDGTLEKELNLMIALELEEMLRSEGIKTRLTRREDILLYDRNSDYLGHKKAQDAEARLKIADEYENAIFISIHMNSFSQKKYKGLQVYYSVNSPQSAALAGLVQTAVSTSIQPDNKRKIKPSTSGVYMLQKLMHPSILIECGFLTNDEDCTNLNSQSYRTRLCVVLLGAVCKYFDTLDNNNSESS